MSGPDPEEKTEKEKRPANTPSGLFGLPLSNPAAVLFSGLGFGVFGFGAFGGLGIKDGFGRRRGGGFGEQGSKRAVNSLFASVCFGLMWFCFGLLRQQKSRVIKIAVSEKIPT